MCPRSTRCCPSTYVCCVLLQDSRRQQARVCLQHLNPVVTKARRHNRLRPSTKRQAGSSKRTAVSSREQLLPRGRLRCAGADMATQCLPVSCCPAALAACFILMCGAATYRSAHAVKRTLPTAWHSPAAWLCSAHLLYVNPQHKPSPVMRPYLLAGYLHPGARHTAKVQHLSTCSNQHANTLRALA